MKIKRDSVLWITGEGKMDKEILADQNITVASIPAAGLHGVGLAAIPGSMIKLTRGYFKTKKLVKKFRPDVIFFTGGYLGIPVSLAAGKTPSVAFIPDIEPGAALNFLIKRAVKVAVTTNETSRYLPKNKKIIVTGYPIRSDISQWTHTKGMKALKLSENIPVLLVFGGSKGALSINRALFPILSDLLKKTQIVHITGTENWQESQHIKSNLSEKLQIRYHVYPFLHDTMGAALASADLVVCRAGASTLGELPFFGLPAILVPYPHAWRYQHTNAEYLVKNGGAKIIEDKDLSTLLHPQIVDLLENNHALKKMRLKMQKMAKPLAAKQIGEVLFQVGMMKGAAKT